MEMKILQVKDLKFSVLSVMIGICIKVVYLNQIKDEESWGGTLGEGFLYKDKTWLTSQGHLN